MKKIRVISIVLGILGSISLIAVTTAYAVRKHIKSV